MTDLLAPKHPAPFSQSILDALAPFMRSSLKYHSLILDPFAGTGRIAAPTRFPYHHFVLGELEWEWISQAPAHSLRVQANALHLPYRAASFDAAVTSVVYGNRMSDHHNAKDKCKHCEGTGFAPFVGHWDVPCKRCHGSGLSHRVTYRHYLGRPLHDDNAGKMQWGKKYRDLHRAAYPELIRVLKPGAPFFLNVSDHQRAGDRQYVVKWHTETLQGLGMRLERVIPVETRRMKNGANRDARVAREMLLVFRKGSRR